MKKIISKNIYMQECKCNTVFEFDESDIFAELKKDKNDKNKKEYVICPLCKKTLNAERKLSRTEMCDIPRVY